MFACSAGLALGFAASLAGAASHREAPLIALDPAADITDVYAFVSYDQANLARAPGDRKVTLIMNVNDRPVETMRAAHRALRLGTEEAAFHYHAGMIARTLGRPRSALRHLRCALALDPAFDVRQGPTARATLDALESPRLARADRRDAR
jgi:hypothetical protein